MTDYDYVTLAKIFQQLEDDNNALMVHYQNHYHSFRKFDELDYLNLLECKIYDDCLKNIQTRVFETCNFLLQYHRD